MQALSISRRHNSYAQSSQRVENLSSNIRHFQSSKTSLIGCSPFSETRIGLCKCSGTSIVSLFSMTCPLLSGSGSLVPDTCWEPKSTGKYKNGFPFVPSPVLVRCLARSLYVRSPEWLLPSAPMLPNDFLPVRLALAMEEKRLRVLGKRDADKHNTGACSSARWLRTRSASLRLRDYLGALLGTDKGPISSNDPHKIAVGPNLAIVRLGYLPNVLAQMSPLPEIFLSSKERAVLLHVEATRIGE